MTDYSKWIGLLQFAKDNKLPKGEYCLWGRECAERERNGTHDGRKVFYLNPDGFSVSTRNNDFHGKENFTVHVEQEYGQKDLKVSYDFGYHPTFLELQPTDNMSDLVGKFEIRLQQIDVDSLIKAMRGDFEYFIENRIAIEAENKRREIEKKERELEKLKS